MRTRRAGAVALACAAFTLAAGVQPASGAGALDRSFGKNGKVLTKLRYGGGFDAVTKGPRGTILAAGWKRTSRGTETSPAGSKVVVARYRARGKRDRRFGKRGIVRGRLDFLNGANDVETDQRGRVVIAGFTGFYDAGYEVLRKSFLVARFRPNGRPDKRFSKDGWAAFDLGGDIDEATTVMVQDDGRLLIAGSSRCEESPCEPATAMLRLNRDGTPDLDFGDAGTVRITPTSAAGRFIAASGALQADGRILIAGSLTRSGPTPDSDFAVARFNADGSLDATFGEEGVAAADFGGAFERLEAVAVRPAGTSVGAGSDSARDVAVVQFTPGGAPDASFGPRGVRLVDIGKGRGSDIALHAGRTVVGGSRWAPGRDAFALLRLTSDGSLDGSFSGDGIAVTPFKSGGTLGGITTRGDGRTIAVGSAGSAHALARYRP